jgi:hypothetical protein
MTEALIPPKPEVSGWYWIRTSEGHEVPRLWRADTNTWRFVGSNVPNWSPELAGSLGMTFASPTPRPLPTSEQIDAVYVLTAAPKPPVYPANGFAIGYHAGMEYAARKLREALEAKT